MGEGVAGATDSLLAGDREAARVLAESDEAIDALYQEVEQLAQSQLARRATGPKELRYLVEMFGSLHDPAQRWQAVRELKSLQDCLGEFQDAEVQTAEIRAFAAQMLADRSAPSETLLAMGEIAAGLARRQRRARSEFDGRFADFASPDSQARLAALTRTAA